jgi:hypothetical protein
MATQQKVNFAEILSMKERNEAYEIWGEITTSYDGQVALIDMAKAGDRTAVNFLYLKMIPQIATVFWKHFLGPDPAWRRRRLEQGDHIEFASMVYISLMNAASDNLTEEETLAKMRESLLYHSNSNPHVLDSLQNELKTLKNTMSPLSTYNPRVFNEQTDVIDKFGFYLTSSLRNESRKRNTEEMRGGITGVIREKDELHRSSYEEHYANSEDTSASPDLRLEDVEVFELWQNFTSHAGVKLDRGGYPTLRTVFKTFLEASGQPLNVKATAAEMGTHHVTVRTKLTKLAEILREYDLDIDTLAVLMRTRGGGVLAAML